MRNILLADLHLSADNRAQAGQGFDQFALTIP
jgi:hypothetical protein